MSCRSTSGGSVSTALARTYTGLSDKEIQHIFHALKREGGDLPTPSEWDITEWRERQIDLLDRARRMTDTKRDGLRAKLFRSRSEPTPDGATFYAWSRVEARARQEIAIRSIPDDHAKDLDPPGSQSHLYDLDEDGKPTKIWYASYGSNLHRDRFLTYIKGGRPEGSTRVYDGCRDPSIPEEDIPIRFAGARPHFALTSRIWRGGIAFIDTQKGETATGLGRAYTVSRDQFEDVVAQENGLRAGDCADIPYDEVLSTGRVVTGSGPYETLLHIGDYNGAPVLTFTAPFSTRDALGRKGSVDRAGVRMPVLTNKPSAAYLRMIGSGLGETFDMDEVAQADYLRGCPGGDRYTRQQIVRILREEEPEPATHTSSRYDSGRYDWSTHNSRLASSSSSHSSSGSSSAAGSSGSDTGTGTSGAQTASPTPTREPRVVTAPDLPKVDPTVRGFFPAVKTYDSGEEREDGMRRWNSSLRETRAERDRYKRSIERGVHTLSTPEENDRTNARLEGIYESLALRVNELNAKARHARQQAPTTWYSPAVERSQMAWRGERSLARSLLVSEERNANLAQWQIDRYTQTCPPHMREETWKKFADKQAKDLARANKKIADYQARLKEIDTHLEES